MAFRTIIEPFRIHSIEPLRLTTEEYRRAAIEETGLNLFGLHAADVLIDLLTDSGTGAMSRDQWAAIQHGDESYAGSPSWYTFLAAVQELFPFRHVIPTHQGRAAEKILFTAIGGPGKVVPNNTHFDTTRANIEYSGAEAVDLPIPEALEPAHLHPFKGNMDLEALERLLAARAPAEVPAVMVTITNNSVAANPSRSRTCAACAPSATNTACRSSSTRAASPRTRGSSGSASPAREIVPSPRSCARRPRSPTG